MKNFTRILSLAIVTLLSSALIAQTALQKGNKAQVSFKNGDILKGQILQADTNGLISIKIRGGSILSRPYNSILETKTIDPNALNSRKGMVGGITTSMFTNFTNGINNTGFQEPINAAIAMRLGYRFEQKFLVATELQLGGLTRLRQDYAFVPKLNLEYSPFNTNNQFFTFVALGYGITKYNEGNDFYKQEVSNTPTGEIGIGYRSSLQHHSNINIFFGYRVFRNVEKYQYQLIDWEGNVSTTKTTQTNNVSSLRLAIGVDF